MKPSEASKKLEFHSKQICHGCMHPSMVGWCENHCKLPEAFEMAISALKKQEAKKPDMIWDATFGKIRPHCPVCMASNPTGANYCWNCGQRFIAREES